DPGRLPGQPRRHRRESCPYNVLTCSQSRAMLDPYEVTVDSARPTVTSTARPQVAHPHHGGSTSGIPSAPSWTCPPTVCQRIGQARLHTATDPADGEAEMPYHLVRNEQNMVHTAVAYARTKNRLQTYACTASIGPGSTNMLTGAALATVDRIPVLLLPSDIFTTRTVDPVLQQLEDETAGDVSVNDAFRPVSRYFDRISRPEQLIPAALQAMRVLTDPAETGAVTLSLPQDVQAEAFDWPLEFFRERTWRVARPVP